MNLNRTRIAKGMLTLDCVLLQISRLLASVMVKSDVFCDIWFCSFSIIIDYFVKLFWFLSAVGGLSDCVEILSKLVWLLSYMHLICVNTN